MSSKRAFDRKLYRVNAPDKANVLNMEELKKEWIQEVAEVCLQYNIPLFTKESLREMMGDEFVQEFPWGDN